MIESDIHTLFPELEHKIDLNVIQDIESFGGYAVIWPKATRLRRLFLQYTCSEISRDDFLVITLKWFTIRVLYRLDAMDPDLVPDTLQEALDQYCFGEMSRKSFLTVLELS
jgi:hypothetical protein